MNKILQLLVALCFSIAAGAQETQEQLQRDALAYASDYKDWDSAKMAKKFKEIAIAVPRRNDFVILCDFVEAQELDFDKKLLELSGVTKAEKGTMVGILKVQKFWSLYKDSCYCNTEGLNIKNGHILLMAVASNFMAFPDGLVKDYGININYLDQYNKITVLDFTKKEITRLEELGGQKGRADELKGIYNYLRQELGCKHKSEL